MVLPRNGHECSLVSEFQLFVKRLSVTGKPTESELDPILLLNVVANLRT